MAQITENGTMRYTYASRPWSLIVLCWEQNYPKRRLQTFNLSLNHSSVTERVEKFSLNEVRPIEPSSYLEAISCADSELWIPAIIEEYESLIHNNTWNLCQLPPGRKAIQGKWVLKYKPGFRNTPPRYKARFVIKGYSQIPGLDYTETYTPVAKHYSLRVIMAIAATRDLEMVQLDVKNAFLYCTLDEEIYMQQPEGFIVPGKEGEVCRPIKSLYGLKQASRVWNIKFNEFLTFLD